MSEPDRARMIVLALMSAGLSGMIVLLGGLAVVFGGDPAGAGTSNGSGATGAGTAGPAPSSTQVTSTTQATSPAPAGPGFTVVFRPTRADAADKLRQVLAGPTRPVISVVLPGQAAPNPVLPADAATATAALPNMQGARLCLQAPAGATWRVIDAYPALDQNDLTGFLCSAVYNAWPQQIDVVLEVP